MQQKPTLQVLQRPQNVQIATAQQIITQSLPTNNVQIDQPSAGTPIDDLSNAGSSAQSTSYNQKNSERMRLDEGKEISVAFFFSIS